MKAIVFDYLFEETFDSFFFSAVPSYEAGP